MCRGYRKYMVIERTEHERLAVVNGELLRLEVASVGTLAVLRESEYKDLLIDAREAADWVALSIAALNKWCTENPI